MNERIKLPTTRPGITHRFVIDGVKGYITVGLFEDRPMEIFITLFKEGSTIAGFADSLARLTSIALQYGVPMEVLCAKMQGHRFEPSGLTNNRNIPEVESIIDYVFRWLQLTFPKNESDRPN